jgi:DNA-binding MarR family transcriptional regulator
MVKSLAGRGLVRRARDPADERRLSITLTGQGRRFLDADTVLRPDALAAALRTLDDGTRTALLRGMAELAAAAESAGHPGGGTAARPE